jgi:molecular chaperone DnaK (HSP70)
MNGLPAKPLFLSLIAALVTACFGRSVDPPGASDGTDRVVVEIDSPALGAGGTLVEPIGIETLGGVFTPLLEVGCITPCKKTEVYSTAADQQDRVTIALYRGDAVLAKDAVFLGRFEMSGFEPGPRGLPLIQAELVAEGEEISLTVQDRSTGVPLRVRRVP